MRWQIPLSIDYLKQCDFLFFFSFFLSLFFFILQSSSVFYLKKSVLDFEVGNKLSKAISDKNEAFLFAKSFARQNRKLEYKTSYFIKLKAIMYRLIILLLSYRPYLYITLSVILFLKYTLFKLNVILLSIVKYCIQFIFFFLRVNFIQLFIMF